MATIGLVKLPMPTKGIVLFKKIMVPVDLEHIDQIEKALGLAADLSKRFDAPICYVGVAGEQPGPIARNPAEYEEKLREFAGRQSTLHGHKADAKAYIGHDLVADVDDVLLKAVHDVGADLVVMASHIPTLTSYIWPSNGGKIAAHSDASVFLVR